MKKFFLILILPFVLIACDSDDNVIYHDSGDAYAEALVYNIQPTQWSPLGETDDTWFHVLVTNAVTHEVVNYGAVLFYIKDHSSNYWQLIPDTFTGYDKDGNVYTYEYRSWYGFEELELQYRDSHPTSPIAPDWTTRVKVVIISGQDWEDAIRNVNINNYNDLKEHFDLKD